MSKIARDMNQGRLHDWTGRLVQVSRDEEPITAIVFIHGILSSHERFKNCQNNLAQRNKKWRFFYVNYDYHAPIRDNGVHFAKTLRKHFRDKDKVVVIAHSMGGIVTRLACLLAKMPFIRTVFLLATPNHGAFRTSSLGIFAQMTRGLIGEVWGIRPKKKGIFELTEISEILAQHTGNPQDVKNTEGIDYISIPGRYFHPQRGILDHRAADAWKVIFGGLDVGFDLIRALLPLFSIKLQRAHDGIVEEASNSLIPEDGERRSEKRRSIRRRELNPASRRSYAHIVPDSVKELVHVQVPDDQVVIDLIGDIIAANNLESWLRRRAENFVLNLDRGKVQWQ